MSASLLFPEPVELIDDTICKLYQSGKSIYEINKVVDRSKKYISRTLDKNRVAKRNRRGMIVGYVKVGLDMRCARCSTILNTRNIIIAILVDADKQLSTTDIAMSAEISWDVCRKHLNTMYNDNLLNMDTIDKTAYWSLKT